MLNVALEGSLLTSFNRNELLRGLSRACVTAIIRVRVRVGGLSRACVTASMARVSRVPQAQANTTQPHTGSTHYTGTGKPEFATAQDFNHIHPRR